VSRRRICASVFVKGEGFREIKTRFVRFKVRKCGIEMAVSGRKVPVDAVVGPPGSRLLVSKGEDFRDCLDGEVRR
jgi:hypothetical protein